MNETRGYRHSVQCCSRIITHILFEWFFFDFFSSLETFFFVKTFFRERLDVVCFFIDFCAYGFSAVGEVVCVVVVEGVQVVGGGHSTRRPQNPTVGVGGGRGDGGDVNGVPGRLDLRGEQSY